MIIEKDSTIIDKYVINCIEFIILMHHSSFGYLDKHMIRNDMYDTTCCMYGYCATDCKNKGVNEI